MKAADAQKLIDQYEKDLKNISNEKSTLESELVKTNERANSTQAAADKAKVDLEAAKASEAEEKSILEATKVKAAEDKAKAEKEAADNKILVKEATEAAAKAHEAALAKQKASYEAAKKA